MSQSAKRVVLVSRPVGEPKASDFRVEDHAIPTPGPGEVLLRTVWLSLDPYMRGRMSDGPSYATPVPIDGVMEGGTVSEVIASNSPGFAKLGGMQRDGSVAVDRYISYRRGKDIVSLSVFLLKDQPVEAREFHVIAPQALLDGAMPVTEIRPTATEAQKQSADSGLAFKDLPSAAAAFDAAMAKITA